MKFEVSVDTERGLQALEAAREDMNGADLPSFVQTLIDQAVDAATLKYLPITLPEALKRISELEGQNADLAAKVSAQQPAAVTADATAQPAAPSA